MIPHQLENLELLLEDNEEGCENMILKRGLIDPMKCNEILVRLQMLC